jgi:hypothetical protein
MRTISLRLPESLHRKAKELAQQEGISINQLVPTARAEIISALAVFRSAEQTLEIGTAMAASSQKCPCVVYFYDG